jgi:hypothetical protein
MDLNRIPNTLEWTLENKLAEVEELVRALENRGRQKSKAYRNAVELIGYIKRQIEEANRSEDHSSPDRSR